MGTPVCSTVPVRSLCRHTAPDAPGAPDAPPTLPGGELFMLRLASPGWLSWEPGQFVMIRPVGKGSDLTWARPFSICYADDDTLEVFFQVAGRGTGVLKTLAQGDMVDVWGPLGNSFAVEDETETLLLAGGIGLAPFVGYIARHPSPGRLHLDFGHRHALACYPFERCSGIDAYSHLECSADDLACFIDTLENGISHMGRVNGLALACGPMPFLRTVQALARKHSVRAQLSLETRMACGVGACLGCVVKQKNTPHTHPQPEVQSDFSWVQTCTCGPVFWAHELDLEGGA